MILIVTFIFFTFALRFIFLQLIDAKKLQIHAVEQWVRTLPLTAKRGQITDSQGNILAISYTSYDVFVRAREVENPAETATFISTLTQQSFDNVYQKCLNKTSSEVLIKLQIDQPTALKIVQKNLKGIYIAENIYRHYPYGKTLCQVLGFLTSDSVGQSGVECFYEQILCGKDGKYLTQSDVKGITLNDSLNYYIDPIDGINLSLNIDINIQLIVEKAIEQLVADHSPKMTSAIVMNPQTFEILALAINPSFDLNTIPRDDISTLLQLTKNVATSDVYEPGSTFKILTLAAALSENLTSLDDNFYCPGYRMVDGQKIKCWKTTGHGSQTLVEAVQNSCNCCFMDLALRLGKQKLYNYLQLFGIGTPSGVDISGESGGILLPLETVKNVDLARIGFGQTVAVNQLQLLTSFCSAVNGGSLHNPSLLKSFSDENGDILFSNTSLMKNSTISPAVSETMRYLLEMALSKTGEMTFVEGYKVCGKTGTAQKYGADGKIINGKYVSSFFGFLNDNGTPKYALLLCVDESASGMYYGSIVAKPYAKVIFEELIKYKNIIKADPTATDEKIILPSFIGLSLSQAIIALQKLNVNYEVDGEGAKVVGQFPSAGESIFKSTTILIKTA